jgi:excisionase family DNA binding protein
LTLTQAEMMRAQGYVTVKEAAARLGRSVPYVYDLLDNGKVHGVSSGAGKHARRYVQWSSLVDYVGPEAARLLGLV